MRSKIKSKLPRRNITDSSSFAQCAQTAETRLFASVRDKWKRSALARRVMADRVAEARCASVSRKRTVPPARKNHRVAYAITACTASHHYTRRFQGTRARKTAVTRGTHGSKVDERVKYPESTKVSIRTKDIATRGSCQFGNSVDQCNR